MFRNISLMPLCLIVLSVLPDICAATIFTDDLKYGLGGGWRWFYEDSRNWRSTASGLEISSNKTSIYRKGYKAANTLLRPIDASGYVDISVTARITSTTAGEQGGIIFYNDGNNYVKLVIEEIWNPKKVHLIMLREQNGVVKHPHDAPYDYPGDDEIRVVLGTNPTYEIELRLVLENNWVTMYWRSPGRSRWNKINEAMRLPGKSGQWYAGLLTMWGGPSKHWQRYRDFSLTSSSPVQVVVPPPTDPVVITPTSESTDGGNNEIRNYSGEDTHFNGRNEYLETDKVSSLPVGAENLTVSAWARSSSTSRGYKIILGFGKPEPGKGIWIGRHGTSLSGGAYANDIKYPGVWANGNIWHHVAMTYNGTTARFYLDGKEVRRKNIPWNIQPGILRIGRQINNHHQFWSGDINDVRIYNRTLTARDIQNVMRSASDSVGKVAARGDSGLVFHYFVSPNTYQAEKNTRESGTKTRTDGHWWTGDGFKDMFRSSNSFIEWNNVTSTKSSAVTLKFTYTNGDGFNRPCTVYVNGTAVGTVNFVTTGDWDIVGTHSINVRLNPGVRNTIQLQSASRHGGPDLDKMSVVTQ